MLEVPHDEDKFTRYFDPNQDLETRRQVKRESRVLESDFKKNRDRLLRVDIDGLGQAINRAATKVHNAVTRATMKSAASSIRSSWGGMSVSPTFLTTPDFIAQLQLDNPWDKPTTSKTDPSVTSQIWQHQHFEMGQWSLDRRRIDVATSQPATG